MEGKVININLEETTVEIAGKGKDNSFFNKGYLYSFSEYYTTKEGKETNAMNWMIGQDGDCKIKVGDVVEYFYEKVDGSDISTLKSIKRVNAGNTSKPSYNKSGGSGMTNKQLAIIIAASYLSGKGITDWAEFLDDLSTISYAAERDIDKLMKN